jgi:polar amino acid transport system substrate-binding protein
VAWAGQRRAIVRAFQARSGAAPVSVFQRALDRWQPLGNTELNSTLSTDRFFMLTRRTAAAALLACGVDGLTARRSWAETVMRISTLLEDDPATLIAERIMREAYRRLDIGMELLAMPGERSLVSADRGETDGELYRKLGIDKIYPHLVRVPFALETYEIVVFTKGTQVKVESWESLRPYRIGFVKGIKIVEEKTVGMQVEAVATMQQAFSKLDLGRTDIVLANRLSGLASLRAHQFRGVNVVLPPLASFDVFHYVNEKHAALVPKLTAILNAMDRERTIQRIREDVLASL